MKMPRELRIRIDTSSDDGETVFEEQLSSDFLDLKENDELVAESDIKVLGKVYRASEWVMVEAYVSTTIGMPCAMCNERCSFGIDQMFWEQSVPLSSVRDGVVDLSESLREAILLEIPLFTKCGGDVCRNIDEVRTFLRSEDRAKGDEGEEKNQPFLSLL
jgi:uncharacterized metal-binding protein YceD (DUF177 family)